MDNGQLAILLTLSSLAHGIPLLLFALNFHIGTIYIIFSTENTKRICA